MKLNLSNRARQTFTIKDVTALVAVTSGHDNDTQILLRNKVSTSEAKLH